MSSERPSLPFSALVVGLAGTCVACLVLALRRPPEEHEHAGPPIGRVGEPGPNWSVNERIFLERGAGEVAQHLHDWGGLPGLDGGREGPAMDKIDWEVPGSGHFEAEVHGLPGAGHTELTVRVDEERSGARAVAHTATSAVLGTSTRTQVREALAELKRTMESHPEQEVPRASSGGAAPSSGH